MNKKNVRRINFFGGPCTGKSTISSFIFSELKKIGYDVEIVREYVKFWTYINKRPIEYDQYYINAKQVYKENTILRQVDLVISDSPLYLQYIYSKYYDNSKAIQQSIYNIAHDFEKIYPSINILLNNNNDEYNMKGRFQKEDEIKYLNDLIVKEMD
ncbi:MAG: AAA family ATPase, partial [archaeon]